MLWVSFENDTLMHFVHQWAQNERVSSLASDFLNIDSPGTKMYYSLPYDSDMKEAYEEANEYMTTGFV